jgi:cell wall-associated NlpC family hydrolase
MNEDKLIEEAKSWKGTKWMHGQAVKGAGADCIQFIVAVYKELELLPKNFKTIRYNRDYALHNSDSALLREIKKYCHIVSLSDLRVGDILLYKYDRCEHHAAIYIGNKKIIQSKLRIGVVESYLSDENNFFKSAWRLN